MSESLIAKMLSRKNRKTFFGLPIPIGSGQERKVYGYKPNSKKVLAVNKEPRLMSDPESLKTAFYTHQILSAIYPNNFPSWSALGINEENKESSIRSRVRTRLLDFFKNTSKKEGIKMEDGFLDLKKEFRDETSVNIVFDYNYKNFIYGKDEYGLGPKYLDQIFALGIRDISQLDKILEFAISKGVKGQRLSNLKLALLGYKRILEKHNKK